MKDFKFTVEREIYKKVKLEKYKKLNKANKRMAIFLLLLICIDLLLTGGYILNNPNINNLKTFIYILISMLLLFCFLYSVVVALVNKKYEPMLADYEYNLLEGKLNYEITLSEHEIRQKTNGFEYGCTYSNIKAVSLEEKYILIETKESKLMIISKEGFKSIEEMKEVCEEIKIKSESAVSREKIELSYSENQTKVSYKVNNKDIDKIACVKGLTDVNLQVIKEISKLYHILLAIYISATLVLTYKIIGLMSVVAFIMFTLAIVAMNKYNLNLIAFTKSLAIQFKEQEIEREKEAILKNNYIEIKSLNIWRRYEYKTINGLYEIDNILWLAKDNKPIDYIILNSFNSEEEKKTFIEELEGKIQQKDNYEFLLLQRKRSKGQKILFKIIIVVFFALFIFFMAVASKKQEDDIIKRDSVNIYNLQHIVEEQLDIDKIINKKNKVAFDEKFDYLESFSLENIERPSNNEITADINVKIIYDNAYEYCTAKAIFNYKNGQWNLKDIDSFNNYELKPKEGAGSAFIKMISGDINNKGAFIYEGETYKFALDYLDELRVLSSEEVAEGVRVGVGKDGYDMYAVMSFDERNLKWNLISFQQVRAR